MLSTPAAIVMSQTPDWMRFAAKWIACCDEPHCRSTVVAGTSIGIEVIERLAEHRAKTYRTDWFGPVTFYVDAAGVRASVAR